MDSFGEGIDPKYYEMVQFYFDRIPALKPYRPVENNKYRKEQVKFYKLQLENSHATSDLKEWTFLPYSEHRNLGVMNMDMRITLDAVDISRAKATEMEVKKAFIAAKDREMIAEYKNRIPLYEDEIEKFVTSHANQIIEKRTQLMIESKPKVLEIILEYMRSLNNEELPLGKFSHTDYLPFADIVPAIIDSMENPPDKPKLSYNGFSKE